MDEKTCNERMNRLEEMISTNERRINNHSDRTKFLETEIVGMKKDTSRLEEILNRLERAIDNLNDSIMEMKSKPLEKYEKIAMYIITVIIGIVIGKFLN